MKLLAGQLNVKTFKKKSHFLTAAEVDQEKGWCERGYMSKHGRWSRRKDQAAVLTMAQGPAWRDQVAAGRRDAFRSID